MCCVVVVVVVPWGTSVVGMHAVVDNLAETAEKNRVVDSRAEDSLRKYKVQITTVFESKCSLEK